MNIIGELQAGDNVIARERPLAIKRLVAALAFSGCAALAYQVAWQRVLTQVIGSDAISMVLVVTIFMICLGIGAELARYFLARFNMKSIYLYAFIEIGVGLYGLISIPLMRFLNENFANYSSDLIGIDFVLNLLILAPPIIGMGLTTPLIVHIAKHQLKDVGRTVGMLYGWNIIGAAAGSILTGLVLIELIGLIGTSQVAAVLNIMAAVLAFTIATRFRLNTTKSNNEATSLPAKINKNYLVVAVFFGFGTLAIQVIFFRILSNYFTLSTIVFPIVLCAYLCLMALGQWVGGRLADKYHNRLPLVVSYLFALGAVLFLLALKFPPAWAAYLGALHFTSFNGQLIANFPHLIGDPSPIVVFIFSILFMSSVIAWSGLFPVMFRLITKRIEDAGTAFARMYTLYTVGNVLGVFICGIVLLPLLGTGGTALVTVLLLALGCIILFQSTVKSKILNQKPVLMVMGIIIITAMLMPLDYYRSFKFQDYKVIDVFEGRTGVATVVPTSKFYTIVDMNRTASASALNKDPGAGDQYEAWRWNHTDLMALDPEFRPERVLIIGIGHAYLIDAMLDLPFIKKIVVVDLSEEVVEAVKKHTQTSTRRIFEDPRVEIVIADGRRYIQGALKRGEKFDLIQNKINEPWHAGGGNLFTEEFFEAERQLLRPGGYLSTRPLNGHLTDGVKVFGNALWVVGYYHMYFKNDDLKPVDIALVTNDIKPAWFKILPGKEEDFKPRTSLSVVYFKNVPDHLRSDPNTDDHPTFEYYWLRQLLGKWVSPRVNLLGQIDQYIHETPVSME